VKNEKTKNKKTATTPKKTKNKKTFLIEIKRRKKN
jgi:hypothetical protein